MIMRATRYEILRNVKASETIAISLAERPVKVATLIDEKHFIGSGCVLTHLKNVFLEDHVHDWRWHEGNFRYYTRLAEVADVLVVYEMQKD